MRQQTLRCCYSKYTAAASAAFGLLLAVPMLAHLKFFKKSTLAFIKYETEKVDEQKIEVKVINEYSRLDSMKRKTVSEMAAERG